MNQRRVDVYLPDAASKARWNREARKRDLSLTQWVIQVMEGAMAAPEEEATRDRLEQAAQVEFLTAENTEFRARIQELESLKELAETELAEFRAQQLVGPNLVKQLEPKLVGVLVKALDHYGRPRVVEDKELRRVLAVKTQVQAKALAYQLEILELHQQVKRSGRGWVWIG